MSKILFLVNHDVVIYNFRLELVERLLADGYEVVISSPYGERIDDLVALGCKYREISISRHGMNPITELKLLMEYRRLMKEERPDVVLTYTIKPNIYGGMAAKSLKIPYVANITGLGTAVENGGIVQKITTILYKIAFTRVRRVFFQNSENMEFFVSKNIATDKHALLPGSGVNLTKFAPVEYPDGEVLQFAFISRIMKEKGVDQYMDAAEYIHEKYPNTRFHICGFCEQTYEEKLKELESRGVVIYHGMVKDVRGVIGDCHCIVHPTYYPEGMSNVLLESSALARPIITTDRSGCREIIDDGVNGYVVRQRDSQDLIEKLEKFISLSQSERREMGIRGREKVEREFDRQIVVDAYMREIEWITKK